MKEHITSRLINDLRIISECWRRGYIKDWGRLRTTIVERMNQADQEQAVFDKVPGARVTLTELEAYRNKVLEPMLATVQPTDTIKSLLDERMGVTHNED